MSRLRKMEDVQHHETRICLLEQSIGHINQTLIRLESKMDQGFIDIGKRLDKMDDRLDKMDGKLSEINSRIWSNFLWILSIMIGLSGAAFTLMTKGFHWL